MNNHEIWLTFAEDEEGRREASLLARSLRRVFTSRKIYLLTKGKWEEEEEEKLFDGVILLPSSSSSSVGEGQPLSHVAPIYAFSLTFFRKICVLDPRVVVLRNPDDLFDLQGLHFMKHLWIVEPSSKLYASLHGAAGTGNGLKISALPQSPLPERLYMEEIKGDWLPATPSIVYMDKGASSSPAAKQLLALVDKVKGEVSSPAIPLQKIGGEAGEPVAIIGMAARLPGSNNVDEFWSLLINKENAVRPIREDRWTPALSCVTDADSATREVGFLKCPVDHFDSTFFGMSPMELTYTDPQQRLLLEVAWEALEDAVIDPSSLYGANVGVFTSMWEQDYRDLLIESGFKGTEFFRTFMGNSFGASSARISYFLGTTGPNIAVESGCSGSFISINAACASLRKGESSLALCCGANLLLHPFRYEDMKAVISPDSRCKAFDAEANGFARAEGVACLVLKTLSAATRDGDKVLGIVKGSGVAQEGLSKSLGTPTVHSESLAMELALKDAGVEPWEVSYLEAHGTGTKVGDPMEIMAIAKAYGGAGREREAPLLIGSVKTNIGHTEACSGMASVIKILKAFEHEVIPPHQSLRKLNPAIALSSIPATIPTKPIPWKRNAGGRPRIAGVSNFGISGTDCHLILQEPAPKFWSIPPAPSTTSPPFHLLTLSAKSKAAFGEQLANYRKYIGSHGNIGLGDVAYTANTGRAAFSYRAAFIAKDVKQLVEKMDKFPLEHLQPIRGSIEGVGGGTKVGFFFTGQGSQYLGMGRELYELYPAFRAAWDRCEQWILRRFSISIQEAVWNNPEKLRLATYCQTGIFMLEYALTQLWASWGVLPDVVVGHSMGEFAAAVAANLLSVEDALLLAFTRSSLVDSLPEGRMIAVQAPHGQVLGLKEKFSASYPQHWLDVAANNAPAQTVLCGKEDGVAAFQALCNEHGLKTTILESAYAYHSRDMDPVLPALRKAGEEMSCPPEGARCVFISGSVGTPLATLDHGSYWAAQTRGQVRFADAAAALKKSGVRVLVELGPTPILTNLFKLSLEPELASEYRLTFSQKRGAASQLQTILEALSTLYLSGVGVDWRRFHREVHPCKKISLPFYPFQRKGYWFPKMEGRQMGTKSPSSSSEHPLIGNLLDSPDKSNRLFLQHGLTLEEVPWVKDHALGDIVVFPGAGYVEMGFAIARALGRPLSLQNIKITSAWVLEEGKRWEVQAIAQGDSLGFYTKGEKAGRWTLHASAHLSEDNHNPNAALMSTVRERKREPLYPNVYSYLAALGYNFGPLFQTISGMWKGEDDIWGKLEFKEAISASAESWVLHPVIIDAVMQAFVVATTASFKELRVPVYIHKFSVTASAALQRKGPLTSGYIHIHGEGGRLTNCTFYAEDGEVVATLVGLETTPTTLTTLRKALSGAGDSNATQPPPMFREEWIGTTGLPGYAFDKGETYLGNDSVRATILAELSHQGSAKEDPFYLRKLEESIGLGTLKSLLDMGFAAFASSASFTPAQLITTFRIREEPHSLLLMRRFLEMLVEDGWLDYVGTAAGAATSFKVAKTLPTTAELERRIRQNQEECGTRLSKEWEYAGKFIEEMTNIFLGKVSALKLLFPETDKRFSAERFYEEADFSYEGNRMLGAVFKKILDGRYGAEAGAGRELRIVEIGAGTGSATKKILPLLKASGIPFTYTFTDISSAFFLKAEKTFKDYLSHLIFRPFNVEQDPLAQGFPPAHYDICIASNVLHATKDLGDAVHHARLLLKPLGHIFLFETYVPQRHFDITVGHLGGYWLFTDTELRRSHCVIDKEQWEGLLRAKGFSSTLSLPVFYGGLGVTVGEVANTLPQAPALSPTPPPSWIILTEGGKGCALGAEIAGRLLGLGKGSALLLHPNQQAQLASALKNGGAGATAPALEGVLYLFTGADASISDKPVLSYLATLQSFLSSSSPPPKKFVLVIEGVNYVGDQVPSPTPTGGELLGLTKVFQTENPSLSVKILDLESGKEDVPTRGQQVVEELYSNFADLSVAYRGGGRFICRLAQSDFSYNFSPLPLPPNDCFQLALPDSKTINDLRFTELVREPPTGSLVEIKVSACAINFRDIFLVFQTFETRDVSVGSDVSGVVVAVGESVRKLKVGDRVFGGRMQQKPLPNYTLIQEDHLILVPPGMSMESAATFPVAFATAYYCLLTLGKLEKGETVLIHTASGGVGLIAIQIAKHLGAKIIATAGNNRKRAYLRSLGITQVYSSRSLQFSQQILQHTGGAGVQLVLNSLTGAGYKEATLAALAKGGRFIEMSKINIWNAEEVASTRPDVKYEAVDLSDHQEARWLHLMGKLREWVWSGTVSPLPYSLFHVGDIREALLTQQRARHIGKAVCTFGTDGAGLFNPRSAYLITGGLKGVGLCVAEWMVGKGGRWFILFGRSEPATDATEVIERMRAAGAKVHVVKGDVGKMEEMAPLFDKLPEGYPPIRGIMHAAGCLSDAPIPKQTADNFRKCLMPKQQGAWNLHLLSKGRNMEHFVLFSSFAAWVGPPGQGNHAASNSFMDQLAAFRNAHGLPALSINWGQWGETGIVAGLKIHAYHSFSNAEGLAGLEALMKAHATNAAVVDGDVSSWKSLFPWTSSYLSNVVKSGGGRGALSKGAEVDTPTQFWDKWAQGDEEDQVDILKGNVRNIVSIILGMVLEEEEESDGRELHLDSLMVIELKNLLQTLLGDELLIGSNDLTDCSTVNLITTQLLDLIRGSSRARSSKGHSPFLKQLMEEDSVLWEDTVLAPENSGPTPLPNIATILLTGSTGNMGPYVLQLLSNRPQTSKIYCLVRGRGQSPESKLTTHLTKLGLLHKINMDKVEVLHGDITEPLLGLGHSQYNDLASRIDAIFHLATYSNHLDPYQLEGAAEVSKIRLVNVMGVQRLLKFGSELRTKWIYFASSIICLLKPNPAGTGLPDSWASPTEYDNSPDFGYAISKYVSERLVRTALERGLPIKVFRLPLIGGESSSGLQRVSSNHFLLKYLYYLECGLMPDDDIPIFLLPVDTAASLSLNLFFDEAAPPDAYNLVNPRSMSEQELVGIGKALGYTIRIISYGEFVEHLKAEKGNSVMSLFKDFYVDKRKYRKLLESLEFVPAWRKTRGAGGHSTFFKSPKVERYLGPLEDLVESPFEIMKRDISYALSTLNKKL